MWEPPNCRDDIQRCWEAAMPGVPCSHTSTLLSPSLFAVNTGNTPGHSPRSAVAGRIVPASEMSLKTTGELLGSSFL